MEGEILGCIRSESAINASEDKSVEENSAAVENMTEGSTPGGVADDLVKSEPRDLDAEACAVLQYEDSEDDTPLIIIKHEEFDDETSSHEPVTETEVLKNDHIDNLKLAVVKLERIDDKNSNLYYLFEKYTTKVMIKNAIEIDNTLITDLHSFDDEKLEESHEEVSDIKDDLKAHSDNESKTNVKYRCDEQDLDISSKLAVVKLERIDDKTNHLYKLFVKYSDKNTFTTKTESGNERDIDSFDCRNIQGRGDKVLLKNHLSTEKEFDFKRHDTKINAHYKCDECGVTYKLRTSLWAHKRKQCFGKRPRERLPPVIKTSYKCAICQEKFYHILTFKNHTRSHTGGKRYECHVCEKGYNDKGSWVNHVRIHTGEKPYSCDQCGNRFRDKSVLMAHKNTHVKERIYQCDVCSKTFVTKEAVKWHLWRVHYSSATSNRCEICKKQFKTRRSLLIHMKIHAGAYQCSVCQKCLSSRYQLKCHMNIHDDVKPYQCETCEKVFRRADCLKRHIMKAHTDERPYPCTLCDKGYVTRGGLTQHMRSHTGERPYKCEVCNTYSSNKHDHSEQNQQLHQCNLCKKYYKKSSFKLHMRDKHSEPRYKCDVCKKGFGSNYKFTVHMRTHTGEKPFQCDVCKKCFKEKKILTMHMHIHMGDLLFECHICMKRLSSLKCLKLHIRHIHSDIKPFLCEVCNQTFKYKLGLDRHICSRNKDRLFECKICNKMFNRKYSYESHCRLLHTGEKPYQCDLCTKRFALRISMINHMRTHNFKLRCK